MDKVKMTTPDGVTENIEKLAALFPAAVTEMRGEDGTLRKGIDFEKLKQLLSRDIVEGGERYEFSWVGKKAAMAEAARPTTETLRPVKADSRDWDTTENLYIEGDNLAALKILQESYLGKVKMIYIDPPYNTGNDFIYADDFMRTQSEENEQMGMFDEDKNHLFKNIESEGKYHSNWCSMIYSRLLLSRNLLTSDGVIFISIDDNEQKSLEMICDEVFGLSNFIGCLVLQTATDNNPRQINTEHEYILCYAKDKSLLSPWASPSEKAQLIQDKYLELKNKYKTDCDSIQADLRTWIKKNSEFLSGVTHYDNVDSKGVFHDGDIANTVFGGYKYEVIHPITGRPCKIPDKGYRFSEQTMREMLANGDIMFGSDETTLIKPKKRLENAKDVLRSVIYEDGRASTKQFESLMARDIFQNPKSPMILSRLINFVIKPGDCILDFFSGSATTAEAVMRLNAKQNLSIKYIMVQLPENLDFTLRRADSRAKKTISNAIAFLDNINKEHTICEIGKERIRRAGDKIKTEHPDADLDIGFRVFRVDSSNMRDVYYKPEEFTQTMLGEAVSNIKPDRTDLDLLYACLLDCGVPIHLPHTTTTVDGCTIHNVDNGALMACFDEHIPHSVIRAMAAEAPLQVIFRDSAFAADADKINVTEIFKNLSPDTKVRVI